jgi:Pretoxin HINT domain
VAGDVVGGYDHTLKKFAWGVVKATKKSIKRGLVSLFAAGTLIAQPTLEHPVWTENHQDYVAAQDLKVGDTFRDANGSTLRLDSLAIKPDTTLTVYNFEVNDLHNYYVGTQEVLVHNDCATLELLEGKGVSKKRITDLENSFINSGISIADRTKFYQKILADLNSNKLTNADVNRLMAEFADPNFDPKIKKFLANFTDKGSLDVWIATKSWSNRLDVLEQMSNIKVLTTRLNPEYTFIRNSSGHIEVMAGSTRWATITQNKVTATAGATVTTGVNNLNQVLNIHPLIKGMEYEVNGRYVYQGGPTGNVETMIDKDIQFFQASARRTTSGTEQARMKTLSKGAKTTDEAGHIVSNEANGPSEQINYWAMNGVSNGSGGRWRNMEVYIKGLKTDNPTATFKVIYKGNLVGGRPSSVDIEVYQNGTRITLPQIYETIPNP